jgi:hypothetical protein
MTTTISAGTHKDGGSITRALGGGEEEEEEKARRNVQKVKGSLMQIPITSTVWTPPLILGCYGKLFLKGLTLQFKPFSM